ncbi:MAG: mannose-1-phosphate guanylyltransferase/mannose-6-phosphate isomerase [Hydrogenothermaceae bacterium]
MKTIILSGGSGTRLFPLSRGKYPKQFLKIFEGKSLIQKTLERALKLCGSIEDIVFVSNKDYKFHIINQIKEITEKEPSHIILEPCKRNTAPAIALGITYMLEKGILREDEPLLVLPSDHLISPDEKFVDISNMAFDIAKEGYIVTFGIVPKKAHTGYGYIESSEEKVLNGYKVKKFHEKPSLDIASEYIKSGSYYWNSGMFCFTPRIFLQEIKKYQEDIYNLIEGKKHSEIIENFYQMPDISIDYAIMEKTDKAVVLPADINWSDVGSFDAVYEISSKDENLNVKEGKVITLNSKNNLIISEKGYTATIGVEDLIVISTGDFTLIARKEDSQKVKYLYNILSENAETKNITENHLTEYRPWGSFTQLEEGERYKIKRITVNPGESLSLQMHYHRSEHWIVVKGTALVVIVDENGDIREKFVRENESFFIPKTTKHRLINPGKIPLEIIEVQVGEYVGEDDIVRFEDRYGR